MRRFHPLYKTVSALWTRIVPSGRRGQPRVVTWRFCLRWHNNFQVESLMSRWRIWHSQCKTCPHFKYVWISKKIQIPEGLLKIRNNNSFSKEIIISKFVKLPNFSLHCFSDGIPSLPRWLRFGPISARMCPTSVERMSIQRYSTNGESRGPQAGETRFEIQSLGIYCRA